MSLYRCISYGIGGLQPGFKRIHAESNTQARKAAFELLREHPQIDRLEVWLGSDLAFRMNRRQARMESRSLNGDL